RFGRWSVANGPRLLVADVRGQEDFVLVLLNGDALTVGRNRKSRAAAIEIGDTLSLQGCSRLYDAIILWLSDLLKDLSLRRLHSKREKNESDYRGNTRHDCAFASIPKLDALRKR